MLKTETFPVGPLQCNCSILWDEQSREAIVVDPGADFERIDALLKRHQLTTKAIVHTHAHFDHVGASKPLREATKAPLLLHPKDRFLWENVPMQGQLFGMPLENPGAYQEDLDHEKEILFGSYKLKTLYTPGHTPGSCSFVIDRFLFAGDTLFQGSIGRTDLWGGDYNLISKSIKDHLYRLDEDTTVVCGHGPNTKIGIEKRENPFVTA